MSDEILLREARPEDAAGIARVSVETWLGTYRGLVPDEVLNALTYEAREASWRQILSNAGAGFTHVAVDRGGQVVGFASGGLERSRDPEYRGELYAIYMRQALQGQGVGRRLAQNVAGSLRQAGIHSMLVWVLRDNPYRRFYERLGGAHIRDGEIVMGGTRLPEVAYGWKDTSSLIGE